MRQEDREYYEQLRHEHFRRRRYLMLQAARYGNDCPPHIHTEIEDIDNELDTIERELHRVEEIEETEAKDAKLKVLYIFIGIGVVSFIVSLVLSYYFSHDTHILTTGDWIASLVLGIVFPVIIAMILDNHE
jgi:hypothetical protein